MTANLLVIKERKRPDPFAVADPSDFEFEVGEAIDPQMVVTNPRITLYCLDHANQRALFVETAPGVNLSQAPFFYQAQYENTVNLYSVFYDTLHQLADTIALDSQKLMLVYSTGRSGSTLIGFALNAVDGVVGISEPDVFTQLVSLREWDGSNEAEISALVKSCMKLLCKPTEQIPDPIAWSIKFRSWGIELGDLLYKHFPDAKIVFLYRQLESWAVSTMRAFIENDTIELRTWFQMWLATLVPSITKHARENGSVLSLFTMGAMMWTSILERYMELLEKGVPMLAFRFEDIRSAPRDATRNIIEYCGFSNVDMKSVYDVLEKDSQAGSGVSQEMVAQHDFELTDVHRADFAQVLKAHPIIHSSDYVVPSTWVKK
jgi:hypothetical protein